MILKDLVSLFVAAGLLFFSNVYSMRRSLDDSGVTIIKTNGRPPLAKSAPARLSAAQYALNIEKHSTEYKRLIRSFHHARRDRESGDRTIARSELCHESSHYNKLERIYTELSEKYSNNNIIKFVLNEIDKSKLPIFARFIESHLGRSLFVRIQSCFNNIFRQVQIDSDECSVFCEFCAKKTYDSENLLMSIEGFKKKRHFCYKVRLKYVLDEVWQDYIEILSLCLLSLLSNHFQHESIGKTYFSVDTPFAGVIISLGN